jgi:hypothetical protein
MRRVLISSLTMATLAVAVPASSKVAAFPPGTWEGTAIWTGSISKQDIFATGLGNVSFTLDVLEGTVGGTMKMKGKGESKVPGGSAKLSINATLDLSGSPSKIQGSGTGHFSGTATAQGFTVPVDISVPAGASFSPATATCTKVTGDLATEGRKVQESYGFNTNVTANFVAVRVAAKGDAGDLMIEYKDTISAILDADDDGLTVEEVLDLIAQVEALNSKILGAAACGGVPPDFQKGLADPLFAAAFRTLLSSALKDADKYTAQQILSMLGTAFRAGVVGKSAPGQAASENLLVEFEVDLEGKLNAAKAAGDTQTILDIYVGAQQAGLTSLAQKAKAALQS